MFLAVLFRTLSILWDLHRNVQEGGSLSSRVPLLNTCILLLNCLWIRWFTLSHFFTWLAVLTEFTSLVLTNTCVCCTWIANFGGLSKGCWVTFTNWHRKRVVSSPNMILLPGGLVSECIGNSFFWVFVSSVYFDIHIFIFSRAGMHLVNLAVSSWDTLLKRKKIKIHRNAIWSCFHNTANPTISPNPLLLILLSHEVQRREERSRYLWQGTWSKQGLKNELITEFTLI